MNVESNHDNWTQDYGSKQDWSQTYGYTEHEEGDEVDEEGEGIVEARGRGTSYTSQEDVWLCKTYCVVGLDASVGTDQTRDTYWTRMKEYFDSINTIPKKDRTDRSDRSLRSRWSLISTECQKWAGVLAATDAMNPSGHNEIDRANIAQNLYKGVGKKNKKGQICHGKPFVLHHAYAALENEEKWRSRSAIQKIEQKKTKQLEGGDDDDDASSGDEGNRSPTPNSVAKTKRPIGRKITKENKKKGGEDPIESHMKAIVTARLEANEERRAAKQSATLAEERRVAAEERRVAAEERKVALEEKKWQMEEATRRHEYEKSFFFMDMSKLDPEQKEYVKICREEILAQKRMSTMGFGGIGAPPMGGFGGIGAPPMGGFGASMGGPTGGFGGMSGIGTEHQEEEDGDDEDGDEEEE